MTSSSYDSKFGTKISISSSSTSFDNKMSVGTVSEPAFAPQLCVVGLRNLYDTGTVYLTCYHSSDYTSDNSGKREFTGIRIIALKIGEYDSLADGYGMVF